MTARRRRSVPIALVPAPGCRTQGCEQPPVRGLLRCAGCWRTMFGTGPAELPLAGEVRQLSLFDQADQRRAA